MSTSIYTLSLHDALPISGSTSSCPFPSSGACGTTITKWRPPCGSCRSEEHTSQLQSLRHLVCRLLLEKKIEGLLPMRSITYARDGYATFLLVSQVSLQAF